MQWHWGNIGSALAVLSTVVIAIAALIRSPGALRDFRERQAAQADAARAKASLAIEQAEELRLERRRVRHARRASADGSGGPVLRADLHGPRGWPGR